MPGVPGYDLRRYGDRRLLRRPRPDVETYGARDAGEILVRDTLLLEARGPVVVGPAAPHRPDVAGLGLERLKENRHVKLGVVGEDADDGPPVHLRGFEELVRPGYYDLVGGREPLAGGEDGPRVADDHAVAHELAYLRDRRGEVYGPEDIHLRWWGEGLDKDRDVLHPALAFRSVVARSGAASFEHAARRLDYRPI